MKAITILLGCLLAAGGTGLVTAQSSPATEDYASLLNQLRRGDLDIDFGALRLAFTRTRGYQPYSLDLAQQAQKMFTAIDQQEFERAVDLATEILGQNYTHSEAHIGAAMAYGGLGNAELARYHAAVSRGLFDSICPDTDGRTPDAPCVITSIEEEHFFLSASGYEVQQRTEARCSTGPCDAMKVLPASGDPFTIYFDVSIPMRYQAARQRERAKPQ